jgi:hypothetical protein
MYVRFELMNSLAEFCDFSLQRHGNAIL